MSERKSGISKRKFPKEFKIKLEEILTELEKLKEKRYRILNEEQEELLRQLKEERNLSYQEISFVFKKLYGINKSKVFYIRYYQKYIKNF